MTKIILSKRPNTKWTKKYDWGRFRQCLGRVILITGWGNHFSKVTNLVSRPTQSQSWTNSTVLTVSLMATQCQIFWKWPSQNIRVGKWPPRKMAALFPPPSQVINDQPLKAQILACQEYSSNDGAVLLAACLNFSRDFFPSDSIPSRSCKFPLQWFCHNFKVFFQVI